MARLLYSVVFYLAQPLVWLRLLWRSRKQPEYLQHVGERYGFHVASAPQPLLWLHVVSVGETRAAEPLIKALLGAYPDYTLLLTHMTPTGRATGGELIAKYGERLIQAYLPYDLPGACGRFLGHFKPRFGLLMETELWPNLIAACAQRSISLALVNARLSAKSQAGYLRFAPLIRPALAKLSAVAAQTPADGERLQAIGAQRVSVLGNIKFDVTPSPEKLALGQAWRQALGARQIWLAASTREGEEAIILDAFARLDRPDLLLLLVPRHPQRFGEVATLVGERGLALCRRSGGELPTSATRVWLGDSMGEMPAYFAVADLALIGGTLLPFGGQNLIEAAACGCPVLVGPHTYNFAQATEDAIASGAAQRIADAAAAADTARKLLADASALQAMRDAAATFSQSHRGATARTLALIEEITAKSL
jgi:3-deoxy-D-manno-octulosonic-acid transferase